jgi:quercetin dioxygenase-like cupin family protein
MYQETGTQLLEYADGGNQEIPQGTAFYLRSVYHTHTNDGAATNVWYNISLWPSVRRAAPLPTSQVAFETADISSAVLTPGAYVETLRRIRLSAGGRSPAHEFGGLEVIFVLDGSLTVKERGATASRLQPDQGLYVPPDTVTQELAGADPTTYLAFFVTREGRPFETESDRAP